MPLHLSIQKNPRKEFRKEWLLKKSSLRFRPRPHGRRCQRSANAVKVTLWGPKGRNVVLGVSVAKEIELKDKFENMGAQMVKEVASRPPTSPVTAPPPRPCWPSRSCAKGMKFVAAGMNPMDLKRGIDKAVVATIAELKKLSKPCPTTRKIAQVGRSPPTATATSATSSPARWTRSARKA